MGDHTRLGELLAGVEGLALLRLMFTDAAEVRDDRLAELREVLATLDAGDSLDDPVAGREHDVDSGYRVWSRSYDQPLRLFPIEAPIVHRLVDGLPVGVSLDAACGSGRHSDYLVAAGHEVIGVDRSEPMLALARRNVPRAVFARADLSFLPLDDGSVDAALCALALVHVVDLDAVFREFARVVKVGGRLIVSDVHPMLVTLGWQAQFDGGGHGRGFIRLNRHLFSDYIAAGTHHGFTVTACLEPPLTAEAARTPTAGRIPEASEQAFAGLPAVVVWEFERI